MTFRQLLGKQLICADGGMGTYLQEAGLAVGEAPMLWNLTHPAVVKECHLAYLDAGATFITTNTFGASSLNLADEPYSVNEVITAGVSLAHEALQLHKQKHETAELADKNRHIQTERFIALDIGPLGQLLEPLGLLGFNEAVELFTEQIAAGVVAGIDLILIETMIDTYELKAAVLAAREASDVPIVATVAINEQGRLLNGADLKTVGVLLEGLGVDALGLNCGAGPSEVSRYIEELAQTTSLPLVLSPNAGLPLFVEGKTTYPTKPEEFAALMKPLVKDNAAIAGGCCGTTPKHIDALVQACGDLQPVLRKQQTRLRISSSAVTVDMENDEVVIDQTLSTEENAEFVEALIAGDYEYVLDDALAAQANGAQVISINAQHPLIDETVALPRLIEVIQGVVTLPLCLVSANLEALERALRLYNGCPLVDLDSFESGQREQAQGIAARYGAHQLLSVQ